jgi:hypothetical protein
MGDNAGLGFLNPLKFFMGVPTLSPKKNIIFNLLFKNLKKTGGF